MMSLPQIRRFIEAIARGNSTAKSERMAGCRQGAAFAERRTNAEFATMWRSAYEQGSDFYEDTARDRAVLGTNKGVWHKGVLVGWEKEYSDTLLMFLLKGRRPQKYVHFTGGEDDEGRAPIEKGADVVALLEQKLAGLASRGTTRRLEAGADADFDV